MTNFVALICLLVPFVMVNGDLIGGSFNETLADLSSRELAAMSYRPGDFSKNKKSSDGKINLSDGLSCKRIATSGQTVKLANGKSSKIRFHDQPDGAAVFKKQGGGGWYYVSNSEVPRSGGSWNSGGVGRIEFDNSGRVVGYDRIGDNMRMNCGGGMTPWDSWVTCEEIVGGKVWQIDPEGKVKGKRRTALGTPGRYESFAYDTSTSVPTFYVTRDEPDGVLTRFTPNKQGMDCYRQSDRYKRWCTLEYGTLDYLVISGGPDGKFKWTKNISEAKKNAKKYYPGSEGIDSHKGKVYFVSKTLKRLVILDLKRMRYTYSSTQSGAFNLQPDQVKRIIKGDSSILYFCEDGGATSGVFGRNAQGKYFTIMTGRTDLKEDETTGLAFSHDAKHMYVSYQEGGWVYDCTRDDKRPFNGAPLGIKYHAKSVLAQDYVQGIKSPF